MDVELLATSMQQVSIGNDGKKRAFRIPSLVGEDDSDRFPSHAEDASKPGHTVTVADNGIQVEDLSPDDGMQAEGLAPNDEMEVEDLSTNDDMVVDGLSADSSRSRSAQHHLTRRKASSASDVSASTIHSEGVGLRRGGVRAAGLSREVTAIMRGLVAPALLFLLDTGQYRCGLPSGYARNVAMIMSVATAAVQLRSMCRLMTCRLRKRRRHLALAESTRKGWKNGNVRADKESANVRPAYWEITAVNNAVLRIVIWTLLFVFRGVVFFFCVTVLYLACYGRLDLQTMRAFMTDAQSAFASFLSWKDIQKALSSATDVCMQPVFFSKAHNTCSSTGNLS